MRIEPSDLTRYLDGELPLDALPGELRAEAWKFDRIAAALKSERVAAPPELRERVMARVRAAAAAPWRRGLVWVMTPKTVRLSPARAVLALAAAVALIVVTRPYAGPTAGPVPAATAAAGSVTRFVFLAPEARSVVVTGDFVGWDPAGVPLADPRGAGVWVAELRLEPGVHHYVFVVNGTEWRPDPNASQVDDGFGQKNSVVLVPRTAS